MRSLIVGVWKFVPLTVTLVPVPIVGVKDMDRRRAGHRARGERTRAGR